ncbi:MAG: hypothetical protein R3C45_00750 [Phycisphaerales bacterium]
MCRLTINLTAAVICLSVAHVRADHVDILAYDLNGKIDTGYIDVDTGTTQTGARLFTESFTQVLPSLYGTTAPGFFSNSAYPLLPSSDLSFDALAITHPDTLVDYNLLYWDGNGTVDFGAPAAGTTLQFRLSSAINVSVDGSASDVAGFVIDGSSPDGVMHKHISYSARGAGGTQPADGLYLAAISLGMPGLTDSDPVYLLFNADYQRDMQNNIVYIGDAPQVDPNTESLAVAWIEQNLINSTLPGDLNTDGFVGIGDLNIVLGAWNQNVSAGVWLDGDPSGDGFVGIEDLNAVLGNWNAGTPPEDGSVIPEPTTFLLLAVMGLFARHRR